MKFLAIQTRVNPLIQQKKQDMYKKSLIYGSQFASLKNLENTVMAKLSVLFDADRSFSSWNRASKTWLDLTNKNFNLVI